MLRPPTAAGWLRAWPCPTDNFKFIVSIIADILFAETWLEIKSAYTCIIIHRLWWKKLQKNFTESHLSCSRRIALFSSNHLSNLLSIRSDIVLANLKKRKVYGIILVVFLYHAVWYDKYYSNTCNLPILWMDTNICNKSHTNVYDLVCNFG